MVKLNKMCVKDTIATSKKYYNLENDLRLKGFLLHFLVKQGFLMSYKVSLWMKDQRRICFFAQV